MKILRKRWLGTTAEYEVMWQGYEATSWEPVGSLTLCIPAIEFERLEWSKQQSVCLRSLNMDISAIKRNHRYKWFSLSSTRIMSNAFVCRVICQLDSSYKVYCLCFNSPVPPAFEYIIASESW